MTCSNEHSLLRENLESATPLEIKIGDKLCTSELPLPKDTPSFPIYKNKLTVKILEDYEIPDEIHEGLHAELAFAWGMFFADGSCGVYKNCCKASWAINNQDISLLERCQTFLKKHEKSLGGFKILNTMKSSHVYKLVAFNGNMVTRNLKNFIIRYRELFYNHQKYKKIPDIILNAPFAIRQSFFMGYYAGDGSKKTPVICFSNKGPIGSAGLFYLLKSLGYKNVSVNTRIDKPEIYNISAVTKFNNIPNAIKKIVPMENNDEFIYDIQTENHHFAAGVGQLVVHNSNYVTFPKIQTITETWDYALKVAEGISKEFPSPMKLEFENTIYERFLILSKKRYMFQEVNREGILSKKIGKKGVILARRDNSGLLRNSYEKLASMIFDRNSKDTICDYLIEYVNNIFRNQHKYADYVVTKSVGESKGEISEENRLGDYKVKPLPNNKEERLQVLNGKTEREYAIGCCPAQVQLAEKMKKRGILVDAGSRLEYVALNKPKATTLGQKIEDYDYFIKRTRYLQLDHIYYLHTLVNPLDQMLNVGICNKTFMADQYKIRVQYQKVLNELYAKNINLFENGRK